MSDAVAVVTDSLADLGPLAAQNDIAVVPLTVTFGSEQYRDGVDLSAEQFYEKLATSPAPPVTAQPSPEAFAQTYRRLLAGGAQHVVSIHLASTLSGTYNSALIAAREVGKERVDVIDSRTASAALGMLVLDARERAHRGEPAEAIVAKIRSDIPKIQLFATIPTLTYLARGGRIGQLQGLLGNVLRIVPIITLVDGEIREFEKVRTFARAVDRLVDAIVERAGPASGVRCAVVHSAAAELAQKVADRLRESIAPSSLLVCGIGPSIGTHAGPGAVGAAFIP